MSMPLGREPLPRRHLAVSPRSLRQLPLKRLDGSLNGGTQYRLGWRMWPFRSQNRPPRRLIVGSFSNARGPQHSPPPSLEMQVAQLEALSEIRRAIQNLTKRDWVEWLTLGLVAAAALASVITVLRNW